MISRTAHFSDERAIALLGGQAGKFAQLRLVVDDEAMLIVREDPRPLQFPEHPVEMHGGHPYGVGELAIR